VAGTIVHVAVAAIVNKNNEVLISQRSVASHQGGLWEFPGGKLEPGETVQQALKREIKEELGLRLESFRPLIKVIHHYTEQSVLLDVWKVGSYSGIPEGLEGQAVRWQVINGLNPAEFPEADIAIIQSLQLPDSYLITGDFNTLEDFEIRLRSALDRGIRLVQLRLKNKWLNTASRTEIHNVIDKAKILCNNTTAKLILNVPDDINISSDGIHLDSRKLSETHERPECDLLSASCHNMQELHKAQQLRADFVVLSPVQVTSSHPDTLPLGWENFSGYIEQVNMPVYALGGVSENDLAQAWSCGAQGIAGISALWDL